MASIFHQEEGNIIEIVAAADVAVNDFIDVGGKLGVALISGLTGETVTVKLTGVLKAPKAAEAHSFGDTLTANTTTGQMALAGGDIAAAATVIQDSGSGEATVLCRIN